ncbi:hypothetical protein TrLO_g4660 [Triparma laevis f. longispina]|uniref:Glycosyl transferase CAP10 domain-containing protein n=1 Tax=Triparma laevis f. longispina TaxID=1714387 RepID=A0A9W7CHS9_9STRA|nr:hypothetical protein TrLO_g4660 [Triparma laevis f. longispina]
MALPQGEIRGMLGSHGDSQAWLNATAKFKNGVPRFQSKADALKFMVDYNTRNPGSNPDDPTLKHQFTMLTCWDQIEKHLLPQIEKVRASPFTPPTPQTPTPKNVFSSPSPVHEETTFRLNLPFHKHTNPVSTLNTLRYLFYHMKCGIFCMVKNGELRIFSSFVNKDYRNTWGDRIKVMGDDENKTLTEYYTQKEAAGSRHENIDENRWNWWANGNIICNEPVVPGNETQYWGDQFSAPLRDMLVEACRERRIPDCEFFINKRDYPQLKVNVPRGVPVEPYGFIFDKDDRDPDQDVDLCPEHKFATYAPIFSFYAAKKDRFADIPFPSSEDWEGACGEVFCSSFKHTKVNGVAQFGTQDKPNPNRDLFTQANFEKFDCGWEDKVDTAFFRGTATGGGVTIDDNQRLKVSSLSAQWKNDKEKGSVNGQPPFCDAAIVGWNLRDKKTHSNPMKYLKPQDLSFDGGRQFFTPIYMQSRYKYLIYVDGHCAACRYGFMMRLGSVILKVRSRQVADTMWYFPLLKEDGPEQDHIPVKEDLSDLEEKIRWCRDHDDECRRIAFNCNKVYKKYVARNGLLDYVEMITNETAKRFTPAPPFWSPLPTAITSPCNANAKYAFCDPRNNKYCFRCKKIIDEKKAKDEEEKVAKANSSKRGQEQKTDLRARMLAKRQKK